MSKLDSSRFLVLLGTPFLMATLAIVPAISFSSELAASVDPVQGPTARPLDTSRTYTRYDPRLAVEAPVPSTNGVRGLVSLDMVRAAVILEAEQRWSQFAIGTPIPCADDNGRLVAYQVPVAINQASFPPVTGVPARELSSAALHDPALWATDQFFTFVVSARDSDYPVPVFSEGLPAFLVTINGAAATAHRQLGGEVALRTYYWLGRSGGFFEFGDSRGRTVLVDGVSLALHASDLVLTHRDAILSRRASERTAPSGESRVQAAAYQEQVRQAWEAVRSRAVSLSPR